MAGERIFLGGLAFSNWTQNGFRPGSLSLDRRSPMQPVYATLSRSPQSPLTPSEFSNLKSAQSTIRGPRKVHIIYI